MLSRGFLKQWARSFVAPKSTLNFRSFSLAVDQLLNPDDHPKDILVKNIPFSTEKESLLELFRSCGTITKIDLPTYPDGRGVGSCIVSFTTSEAATAALAHDGIDFKGRWIKVNLNNTLKPRGCKQVFIGNLSYETNEDSVRKFFEICGKVIGVRLAQDGATGKFRGFGHVEFEDTTSVDEAMLLNGTDISGRTIRVSYARAKEHGGKGVKNGGRVKHGGRQRKRRDN